MDEVISVPSISWFTAIFTRLQERRRLLADNFELVARNYERGIEAFTTAIEQQHHQARQAAE